MSYETVFEGFFTINPPLAYHHRAYLDTFTLLRKMKRDIAILANLDDPLREAVGLPLGEDGVYCVTGIDLSGGGGMRGIGILNPSEPPNDAPSLYCNWEPSKDGTRLEGEMASAASAYDRWLLYLIEHFFKPWGYQLNGKVLWQGEEDDDFGTLIVQDNILTTYEGERLA